jgi:predicted lipoprotein with Yx(FWY)xxD motif
MDENNIRYRGGIMNMRMGTLVGLVAAVALAAGCGSTSAADTNGGGGGGSAHTTVQSANNSKLGTSVLVNHSGMTLYTLSAERGGRFVCTMSAQIPGGSGSCLSLWHPLTVAKGSMPTGAAQLSTITRPDTGATQVTWHGRPLYTFTGDKAPGDASGNGFKDVGIWKAATLGAPSSSSSSGGGGYGY